jgi:hypothetical protein
LLQRSELSLRAKSRFQGDLRVLGHCALVKNHAPSTVLKTPDRATDGSALHHSIGHKDYVCREPPSREIYQGALGFPLLFLQESNDLLLIVDSTGTAELDELIS